MNDVLLPQVNNNCRFCNFNQWMPAGVRVLNAAVNYNPFSVTIGNTNMASSLIKALSPVIARSIRDIKPSLYPAPMAMFICKNQFILVMA